MTEQRYKDNDPVTVDGTIAIQPNGKIMVKITHPERWMWTLIEPEPADIRPRAEGAEPEGDVGRLRAACEEIMMWWENDGGETLTERMALIRAALAEEPVGGAVRVGDVVTIRTGFTVRGFDEKGRALLEGIPGLLFSIEDVANLTIVSRPAPAETCGGCRWFNVIDDEHAFGQCGKRKTEIPYPDAGGMACGDFQRWPG